MNRPQIQEYPSSFSIYIDAVEGELESVLTKQAVSVVSFFNKLKSKADYAYAPGKWTIKQLLGHLVDTERVMSYRLMCIARGEQKDLPGFDEEDYVNHARFQEQNLANLGNEFAALRHANILLIKSLNEDELNRVGTANSKSISVRALAFMLAGHVIHHQQVVRDRYLSTSE